MEQGKRKNKCKPSLCSEITPFKFNLKLLKPEISLLLFSRFFCLSFPFSFSAFQQQWDEEVFWIILVPMAQLFYFVWIKGKYCMEQKHGTIVNENLNCVVTGQQNTSLLSLKVWIVFFKGTMCWPTLKVSHKNQAITNNFWRCVGNVFHWPSNLKNIKTL